MLKPSYSDLLGVLNKDSRPEDQIGSRYTIVIATAKRARQLVDHAEPLASRYCIDKPVSIAVEELYEGKIKIIQNTSKSNNDSNKRDSNLSGFDMTSDLEHRLARSIIIEGDY